MINCLLRCGEPYWQLRIMLMPPGDTDEQRGTTEVYPNILTDIILPRDSNKA